METNQKIINEVLTFWFGEINQGLASPGKAKMWYQSDDALDEQIRQRFGDYYVQAANGKLELLKFSARGSLTLIILLDQMSRNMFRGSAKAFATDHLALDVCLQGLERKFDQKLSLIERLFYYHPLEHAESLSHQELCVSLMENLVRETEGKQQDAAKISLQFAREHRDIIAEFGRFPHRNELLGRAPTTAETLYLASGGKTFGQS